MKEQTNRNPTNYLRKFENVVTRNVWLEREKKTIKNNEIKFTDNLN